MNVLVDENTLTEIANKIRAKKNVDTTFKPSEMPTAIEGIVTPVLQEKTVTENGAVLPDAGYNGLSKVNVDVASSGVSVDGGYTINFYDVDKNLIQSHTAKCGMWVDKPISYICKEWINSEGLVYSFPLSVESDRAGHIADVYAVVDGENMATIIDSDGTDFASTFFNADGTPQSGANTNDYTNYMYSGNDDGYVYKVSQFTTQAGACRFALQQPIYCSNFNYLKIKGYKPKYYNSSWNYTVVWLATSNALGNPPSAVEQYPTGAGSWAVSSNSVDNNVLKDPDRSEWVWVTIDISELDYFYLHFVTCGYFYLGEAYLC